MKVREWLGDTRKPELRINTEDTESAENAERRREEKADSSLRSE